MTYHPDEEVSEKPAGTFRDGYGDRVVGPDRVGDRWTAAHIRDDGSAIVFVWP